MCSLLVLQNALFYCEFLLCKKRDKLTETRSPLYKAIIFCALSRNLHIRKLARDVILKFGNVDGGVEIILELLAEFTRYINNVDLKVMKMLSS